MQVVADKKAASHWSVCLSFTWDTMVGQVDRVLVTEVLCLSAPSPTCKADTQDKAPKRQVGYTSQIGFCRVPLPSQTEVCLARGQLSRSPCCRHASEGCLESSMTGYPGPLSQVAEYKHGKERRHTEVCTKVVLTHDFGDFLYWQIFSSQQVSQAPSDVKKWIFQKRSPFGKGRRLEACPVSLDGNGREQDGRQRAPSDREESSPERARGGA